MRFSLRAKIVLFTAIPVLLTHVAVFALGLLEIRARENEDFQRRSLESVGYRALLLDQRLSWIDATLESLLQTAPRAASDAIDWPEYRLRRIFGSAHLTLLRAAGTKESSVIRLGNGPSNGVDDDTLSARRRQTAPDGWSLIESAAGETQLTLARRLPADAGAERLILQLPLRNALALDSDERTDRYRGALLFDERGHPLTEDSVPNAVPRPLPTGTDRLRIPAEDKGTGPTWLFLANLPNHPWRLGLLIGEQGLRAAIRDRVGWVAPWLGGSLALLMTVIWLVANRVTRPLEDLDQTVNEIARGNFAVAPRDRSGDELGRLARAIADMAEQVRIRDQALRLGRNDLERRVAERTTELAESHRRLEQQVAETRNTEEALRQARDEAELASKAKSEFLSNMSHELRTPLNGVLGYAQILRRDQTMTDRQRENLDAIESCGQHLLTLINDVLDISKIEAGRMNVDAGPIDLHKLIKEVYDIVMQRAQSKGLALRVELDPALPRVVRTDGTKLRQILLNLLGNAVKFTNEGWVALRAQDTGDGRMRIEVEDTGIGIPDDKVDMIFDAFKQAEAGMVVGGSGLGLAINQRLIELLGGDPIEVDTALDRGSRFSFCLPLEAVPEDELPETHELLYEDEANVRLAPGQKVKVLVVDDRRENRDILRRLLSDAGFTVEEADNGRIALQMMRDAGFDLILMDIRMPGMSGMEAIREIRDRPETRDQRVIAVTASVFPEFREQIKAAGFDEFLGKPFRSGELFHKIRELLQLHYVGLQSEARGTSAETPSDTVPPEAGWPTALARAAIKRIRSAVELGDITALADLADKLRIDGRAPSSDIDTIARLGRSFDFDGLTEFARKLERSIG